MPFITGYNTTLSYPELVEIIGESGNYYQIKFLYSGYTKVGYIKKSSVTEQVYEIDENYKNELVNLGFPRDYAERLAILHAIHPNWVFTPSYAKQTTLGADFNGVVKGEASVIDRNLLHKKLKDPNLLSTSPGAYNNGVWYGFSGGDWYAVSEQTIAYFLDPRNFMNETNFFMFENQAWNDGVDYPPMVEKSLNGSFMDRNHPYLCSEGSKNCSVGLHYFNDTFVDAGRVNRVNPVSLASRVKVEQGTGSFLSNGAGWNGQYVGYYNFFNISANGATTDDVILNGLGYAYNRGWNNPYISIVEGAGLVGNQYVSVGQSTVYYQKFNSINLNYSHQYMQNILAPYEEGYKTYTTYLSSYSSIGEWDKAAYGFLIPVYQNMPTFTSLEPEYNVDASLQSLSISECNINPSFDSGIKSYECYTSKDTKEVNILASPTSGVAKAEYTSKLVLTSDETTTQIKVTAGNGNVEIYEIKIHRIETDGYAPSEVLNGVGIKVSDKFASNFSNIKTVSSLINAVKGNYHFAEVDVTGANGEARKPEDIIRSSDIITVKNAGVAVSFSAVLYGDPSGDGKTDIRDLLLIQQHIVKARALNGAYYNAADINKDGAIDIRDLLLVQQNIVGQYQISQE